MGLKPLFQNIPMVLAKLASVTFDETRNKKRSLLERPSDDCHRVGIEENGESMSERFEKALAYVLENEGPYSNDPNDPGGATCHGIILTEYQDFLGKTLTPDDVKNMSLDTAKAIYLKKFWNPIQGDSYDSDAKATAIFDTAVNKGLSGCRTILEDVFAEQFPGEIWEYPPELISAVNGDAPTDLFNFMKASIYRHIEERIEKNPKLEKFRKGWQNRADKLLTLADE